MHTNPSGPLIGLLVSPHVLSVMAKYWEAGISSVHDSMGQLRLQRHTLSVSADRAIIRT